MPASSYISVVNDLLSVIDYHLWVITIPKISDIINILLLKYHLVGFIFCEIIRPLLLIQQWL